jgi:hypothetical protein
MRLSLQAHEAVACSDYPRDCRRQTGSEAASRAAQDRVRARWGLAATSTPSMLSGRAIHASQSGVERRAGMLVSSCPLSSLLEHAPLETGANAIISADAIMHTCVPSDAVHMPLRILAYSLRLFMGSFVRIVSIPAEVLRRGDV